VWWWVILVGIGLAAVIVWRWGDELQAAVLDLIDRLSQHL
jgi:hypothetical protein